MTQGEQPEGPATPTPAAAKAADVNKGGRPLGRKDRKKSKARVKEAQRRALAKRARQICALAGIDDPFEGDALALLQAVYKNPKIEDGVRMQAARAAIDFETPRLSAIEHGGAVGVVSQEEALKRLAAFKKMRDGGGNSGGAAPAAETL